jgi:hypothetical protein
MDEESIAIGCDWAEIEEYYERKYIEDQLSKVPDMESRAELDAHIEDIVTGARKRVNEARDADPGKSNRARLSDMRSRMRVEIDSMNDEYRQEILRKAGLIKSTNDELSTTGGSDDADEYVPRRRLENVLSIQERLMKRAKEE